MITTQAKRGLFKPAEVAAQFRGAHLVTFAARPANFLMFRPVVLHFGQERRAILLKCVLESVGILPTDERLRGIFAKYGKPGAPEKHEVDAYDELGFFSIDEREAFSELARLLGKPLRVVREYGDQGHMPHLFDVAADGTIAEAAGTEAA